MTKNNKNFQLFETSLDFDRSLAILRNTLSHADDGEIFFENRQTEALVFDNNHLKNASFNAFQGFGLRGVSGETTGYAHSNEISEAALKRASETVHLAVRDGKATTIALAPKTTHRRLYSDKNPIEDRNFPQKISLLKEINDYARTLDHRVVQVSITLAASIQNIHILRPEGTFYSDVRPMSRLNISLTVEENGKQESAGVGGGGRHGIIQIIDPTHWQGKVKEALRIALINLKAKPAPAGKMPVVLGPGWPGILLHEAVGHGLEGDFNRKKTSAFSELMGQQVAAKGVTVLDDGTIPQRRGSINIDDEGTKSLKNTLIEDGILIGYMQDRQNARLMGVTPTGNGRRESYAHPPMPRMTNTYMKGGNANPADIIKDLKDGLYAVGFGGGQVDITNGKFVFSCTEAYRVKNGKIGSPVKGATLIGDGVTALKHIRAMGNDMALDPGIGNCGKAGQWVPVGVGQPTILIEGLTVGGSQL